MTATAAPTTATFPLRPPAWVRAWVLTLGLVATTVAVLLGVPMVADGRWAMLAPVAVVALAAIALAWRIGGLRATTTPDGRLVVRNRTRTHVLTRDAVRRVEAGTRGNRAGTPVAVLTLTGGGELAVDVTTAAAFQTGALDADVEALRAWLRG